MNLLKRKMEAAGNAVVDGFHIITLFIILFTIIWSAGEEYLLIMDAGKATLKDILLLFIYLELVAMVGIYFKTKRLPVIFLIYIAITALTRVLVVDIKTIGNEKMLALSGAIFILAISGVVLSLSPSKWFKRDTDKGRDL